VHRYGVGCARFSLPTTVYTVVYGAADVVVRNVVGRCVCMCVCDMQQAFIRDCCAEILRSPANGSCRNISQARSVSAAQSIVLFKWPFYLRRLRMRMQLQKLGEYSSLTC